MDPNGDGYITEAGGPFEYGYTELSQKEGIWQRWFQVHREPAGDHTLGNDCSALDIVDAPDATGAFYVGVYDPDGAPSNHNGNEYLLTRLRLAKDPAEQALGFSILIDADRLFGDGTDPNATGDNPGYEIELRYKNGPNGGIFLDDIDGQSSGTTRVTYPYESHHQKVWARKGLQNCAEQAVFMDLGIPFSDLEKHFGVASDALIHLVAATTPAGNPALSEGIVDIAGVDGNRLEYKNDYRAMTDLLILQPRNNILPINLSRMELLEKPETQQLLWETASELQTVRFEVELSWDAIHFSWYETLPAVGTSVQGAVYTSGALPLAHKAASYFVRLKLVKADASFEYSAGLEVRPKQDAKQVLQVFPNPALTELSVEVAEELRGTYRLFDSSGLIALDGIFSGGFRLDVSQLPKGAYYLCLYGDNEVQQQPVLIQ